MFTGPRDGIWDVAHSRSGPALIGAASAGQLVAVSCFRVPGMSECIDHRVVTYMYMYNVVHVPCTPHLLYTQIHTITLYIHHCTLYVNTYTMSYPHTLYIRNYYTLYVYTHTVHPHP